MSISYYQWLTFCILYYLRNIKANGSPCFLIKLVFNAKKTFASTFISLFISLLYSTAFLDRLAKVFLCAYFDVRYAEGL